jgi:hypothetical protein
MSIKGSADVQLLPGPEATWINQRTQGIVASRTHSIVYPKNGGTFSPGQKIRLEIPSQDYWDTSLFTISMQVVLQAGVPSTQITSYGDGTVSAAAPNPWTGATGGIAFGNGGTARTAVDGPLPFGKFDSLADPQTGIESHWLTTQNGVQTLFNRIRILQGSMVIADILDYNKLNKILKITNLSRDHVRSSDFINEGVYDPENWEQKKMARNFYSSVAAGKNNGQYWNVRLNTGFLEIDKYFPTKYTGQITFELFLEEPATALVSSVVGPFSAGGMPTFPLGVTDPTIYTSYPSPTYVIANVQAHVHFVVPIQEYDEEMLATINEQGLTVMYSTWNQHTRQLTSTGRQILSFQERSVSVRGGLFIMENNVDIGDIRSDFQFSSNNIIEYQWKLGNLYVPSQPVQCEFGDGQALFELENFMGTVGNMQSSHLIDQRQYNTTQIQKTSANLVGSGITNLNVPTSGRTYEMKKEMRYNASMPNNFMIGLNLEKSPGQLSGFNTSATNVDIELRLLLDDQSSGSGFAGNMPNVIGRTPTSGGTGSGTRAAPYYSTWLSNQGSGVTAHHFQPSKYKCHDTIRNLVDGGGTANLGFYALYGQADNPTFNGEFDIGCSYTYNELCPSITAGIQVVGTTVNPPGTIPGGTSNRPLNRFPDSGAVTGQSARAGAAVTEGFGEANGGVTSTCFMFTKPVATSVLCTFFAYVDAQLNIMKVGQLEVLR